MDFFVNKHIELRGKPLPFVRKAKRILKVVVKGVHPQMSNDLLVSELLDYIKHVVQSEILIDNITGQPTATAPSRSF